MQTPVCKTFINATCSDRSIVHTTLLIQCDRLEVDDQSRSRLMLPQYALSSRSIRSLLSRCDFNFRLEFSGPAVAVVVGVVVGDRDGKVEDARLFRSETCCRNRFR